jgi:hypothetical protein
VSAPEFFLRWDQGLALSPLTFGLWKNSASFKGRWYLFGGLGLELGLILARQALPLEPLHQACFVLDIFEIGSCKLFAWNGFRSMILLISASEVGLQGWKALYCWQLQVYQPPVFGRHFSFQRQMQAVYGRNKLSEKEWVGSVFYSEDISLKPSVVGVC